MTGGAKMKARIAVYSRTNAELKLSAGLAVPLQFGAAFKVVRIRVRDPLFQTPSQDRVILGRADQVGISSTCRGGLGERLTRRAEKIANTGAAIFGPLSVPVIVDASSEQILLDE